MHYRQEKQYAGHIDQLFPVRRVRLTEGRAKGVALLEVENGSGLSFCINLSRGLDIPFLRYKGQNAGYLSPCGIVAPEYYDDKTAGFLKSFTAGFLTTAGIKYIGAPCEYNGISYGLHGHISHLPAESFCYELAENNNAVCLKAKGKISDAAIFEDKLSLERTFSCGYREKKFTIADRVTNEGYQRSRHMILYHFNIGYPLLCPDSLIHIPTKRVTPRTPHSRKGVSDWMKVHEPRPDYEEQCFYHELEGADATVAVFNPRLGMGVAIQFDRSTLDHFVQWKMLGARDYVIGLEPCNATIDGIEDAVENGSLKYIGPQESVEHRITVKIIDSPGEFREIQQSSNREIMIRNT